MNQAKHTIPESIDSRGGDVELMDFLILFAKYKKLIVGIPIVTVFVAAIVSMLLPSIYSSSTRLLPPQQAQSGAAALLSQLGGVAGLAAGAAGIKNPNDLYVAMLKSRTISDRIIARFDLKKVYANPSQEETRDLLDVNTTIISGKDGLIAISVEDKNQALVPQLANAYVAELVKLTKTMAITEASQRRVFFEQQLERAKDNLANAEVSLKQALTDHGVISVDSDSRAILETVARLRAQVSAKQIQLNSMAAFVTTGNPQYLRTQEELRSLREELSALENGPKAATSTAPAKLGTADKRSGLDSVKILRDVKYYQMLYELLSKQYEVARLDEARDSAIIQVLDPASVPERRSRPKRTIIVLVAAFASLFFSVMLAFVIEAKHRALESEIGAVKWNLFKSLLAFKRTSSGNK